MLPRISLIRIVLKLTLMSVATLFVSFNSAIAVSLILEPMKPAAVDSYNWILNLLDKERDVISSIDEVYVSPVDFESNQFLIIRVRNERCIEDRCLTYIVSLNSKGSRIILAAYLPPKIYQYDNIKKLCDSCSKIYTLTFEGKNGENFSIGLSPNYALMLDGSLKGIKK